VDGDSGDAADLLHPAAPGEVVDADDALIRELSRKLE
jgi:hypothetical protein